MMSGMKKQRQITQHKRFVLYGTHPNSASGGTSFMLKTLSAIRSRNNGDNQVYTIKEGLKWEDIE
jgi:hypothetical protein